MSTLPPNKKIKVIHLWCHGRDPKYAQKLMPKLSCKYTSREEVVDGLILLFIEGALLWMWESFAGQSVSCPATVMSHQP
jgi:hypothetical protein